MKRTSTKTFKLAGALLLGLPAGFVLTNQVVRAEVAQAPGERLENGIYFVARPDRMAPKVAFSILLRSGAPEEDDRNAGWRRFVVNSMLRQAPTGYDTSNKTESLATAAEKAGGSIGATVGDDFIEIWGQGDSAKGTELLKLALALLREPRMADEDIQSVKERMLSDLEVGSGETATKIQAALRGKLYRDARGELAAYGLPELGTADSLMGLTADKVRELYKQRLKNAKLVFSAVGDVDVSGMRSQLAALPATHSMTPSEPFFAAPKSKEPALVVRELSTPVAMLFVAYSLPKAKPEEIPALQVLSAALSDSPAARFPKRMLSKGLVDNRDKAFSVGGQLTPRRYAGEFLVSAQCAPQSVDAVKNSILDEIRKVREGVLTPEELAAAKTLVRGSWAVDREGLRERAFQAALAPALGGPPDTTWPSRVQSVTAKDVQTVAKKYFNNYAVALVMPSGK